MLLVTGPTGSGKTTTLYAILQRIKDETKKIITVEDPVEYKIDGINQIQVKPQINLTFANALRSLVRQDPDVLLIGEIRDAETANIAIESALTGHLVLSTLHTKDAPGAVTRLRDLDTESFLIADSVLAVVAQRLVRVLCEDCREPYIADDAERAVLNKAVETLPARATLYRPAEKGCEKCGFTGFRGREGIFELLLMDENIRSMVIADRDAGSIAAAAGKEAFRSMLTHGYEKVLSGRTTITEILRVTTL
jgi:general secretion pathway protein E